MISTNVKNKYRSYWKFSKKSSLCSQTRLDSTRFRSLIWIRRGWHERKSKANYLVFEEDILNSLSEKGQRILRMSVTCYISVNNLIQNFFCKNPCIFPLQRWTGDFFENFRITQSFRNRSFSSSNQTWNRTGRASFDFKFFLKHWNLPVFLIFNGFHNFSHHGAWLWKFSADQFP
jgi:hypothetical protein